MPRIGRFSNRGDLYKVAAEGGRAVSLTQHETHDFNPVWSPDGRSVAFASDRHGNLEFFWFPPKKATPRRLTTSPDATSSVFTVEELLRELDRQ